MNADLTALLRAARTLVVITGAGISAESGIPTFRDESGWWQRLDPEQLATRSAFRTDPAHVWQWYNHRRGIVARALPNRAHLALGSLERLGKRVLVITQNVDDLHERAGSRDVVHVHGSIWYVTCEAEGRTWEDREWPLRQLPPQCTSCGGILRPAIVWFDESVPVEASVRIEEFFRFHAVDVCLIIGTEATFSYIHDWAQAAERCGARLVEINPKETVLSESVHLVIREPAGAALGASVEEVLENP